MTEVSAELVERMVALVRAVAGVPKDSVLGQSGYASEARAIVAELPVLVDPDLVEAREICAAHFDGHWPPLIRAGDWDNNVRAGVPIALAAIKRGRALAKEEAANAS